MKRQFIQTAFVSILLILVLPLFPVVGVSEMHPDMDFSVELISYDYFSCAEAHDDGDDEQKQLTLWLRFRIAPAHRDVTIDSLKVWIETTTEKILLRELPVPVPNPLGCYAQILSIDASQQDDDAIKAMLREASFSCEIKAMDTKDGRSFTCKGDVVSEKVQHEILKNDGDFLITVDQCVYQPIELKEYFYLAYPGLEEYINNNPGCSYYTVELIGTASKKSAYFALGIEYLSKSSNLFLLRHGKNSGESTLGDHSDMIENGEKQISILGLMCIHEGASPAQAMEDAKIIALYSPEYAGHLELSDAGDRFDGPKVYVDVNIDHVDMIPR